MTDRTKLCFLLMIISCVVVNLIAFLEWNTSYVTNDGVQYLSTAANWLNGKGFSTNALIYTPHFQADFPSPQTVWPPGYPIALALLGMLGIDLPTAGLLLNLIFHALASVLIVLILKRMRISTGYAVSCSVLFYALVIPWSYARGLVAEPFFTCLMFAAVLVLPVPGRSRFSSWLLCGVFVASCIYVRYSAVLFAAGVGTGIFMFLVLHNRRNGDNLFSGCLRLTTLIAIPVVAFLQLRYRTYLFTGTTDINIGKRSPETIYNTIRQWGAQFSDLLGFSEGGVYTHEVGVFLFLFSITLALSLVIYAVVRYLKDPDQDHDSEHALYSRIAGFVMLSHGLLLFVYLSYSTLTDLPLEILGRYLHQAYPGIYVLFCILMYGLISRVRHTETGRIPKPLKVSLAALVTVYLISQANEATSPNQFFAEGRIAQEMLTLPVTDGIDLASYINACIANHDKGSIWSTHGQHLHFNTGNPTLTLAEVYTSEPPNFQVIQQQIETYDIKLWVFLNDDLKINVEYEEHLQQIKAWLTKNGHNAVTLQNNAVNSHVTVDVFQVNEQCG